MFLYFEGFQLQNFIRIH